MIKTNYSKEIILIAAVSENHVLGRDNKLIWHISDDLKRFKKLTNGHSIIMGRKTYESMPAALPGRRNIILTRNKKYIAEDAFVAHSIHEALKLAKDDPCPYVIGGGEIYSLFLPIADKIELTRVHKIFEGDAFFPEIDMTKWILKSSERNNSSINQPYNYSFLTYTKIK